MSIIYILIAIWPSTAWSIGDSDRLAIISCSIITSRHYEYSADSFDNKSSKISMIMLLMILKHFRFSQKKFYNHTLISSNVWYVVQFQGIDIYISKLVKYVLLRNRLHKDKNPNYTSKRSFRPTGLSYFDWKSRHPALDLTWICYIIALKTSVYIVIWLHFFQRYNIKSWKWHVIT